MGRLTRDPDVRWTQGQEQTCFARYTIAVDRRGAKEGQQQADFISCVTFGKKAEFAEKYLRKGIKIVVTGRIQTGSYTNREGVKIYTTDVLVEDQEFAESKAANEEYRQQASPEYRHAETIRQVYGQAKMETDEDGFMHIPDGIDEELPFN
jgi:single-strand DNA-binding protein